MPLTHDDEQRERRRPMMPMVKRMLEKPGVYIGGDSEHPGATVVFISRGGKVYSTVIDAELDPERFMQTVTLAGPYIAGRTSHEEGTFR